jgi:uncharacterized membrane protein YphA (DoxX/SURF4 family)
MRARESNLGERRCEGGFPYRSVVRSMLFRTYRARVEDVMAVASGAESTRLRSILVLPRLFLGVNFSVAVFGKLHGPVPFQVALAGFLTHMQPNQLPVYQSFVQSVVLPHAATFAFLVVAGELYVAVAMLFGVTTRLGALVAAFLVLNYMLAKGANLWTPSSNDAAYFILAVVVGLGSAGRVAGIDRILAARWPRVPLW